MMTYVIILSSGPIVYIYIVKKMQFLQTEKNGYATNPKDKIEAKYGLFY